MVRFRMFRINVNQFAILTDNLKQENIRLETKLGIKYSIEWKRLAVNMMFTFSSSEEKIMMLDVCCEFQIHEEDWNTFVKGGNIVVPKGIVEYFVVQTVGTARGILHCRTEGTPFNHIIIPPLDVSGMVEGDLTIEQ
ncbi:MAG: hypothetical protein E7091_03735 [Bacteroidales bacterium]|nr:hypothetical protein [Bacteroidales bacterium]